ncbi:unnamed protein product [Prorocentrum cordatum]|uniref:Subtilisin n=1 Tax=Prorocentrum cordatum TaxID=2364126 RepID=A0ABN9S2F5_9DINO|nr:unnamed protein product [Polarella glacialis]
MRNRRKYYATVGQINFAEPARMADAGVHLTSRVPNMESQIVIAFAPNYGNAEYRSYDVPLVLRILFRDIDGMLTPLHSGALGESHEALDPELEVPMEGASQALCGKLFVEMWTNDAEGFPLPTGCYVGPLYQDKPSVDPYTGDQEATLPKYREYFIVFGSNNGLKSICIDYRDGRTTSCVYQLVLNAFIHSLTAVDADGNNQEPVSIFTLCANHSSNDSPCGPPYSVIEYGKARASRVTVSTDANGLELRSVDMSPLGSAKRGVTVDSPYELEESTATFGAESFAGTNLEFRAYPQTQTNPIRPGAFLRIFFFPLTIWDLGFTEACAATCISPPGHVSAVWVSHLLLLSLKGYGLAGQVLVAPPTAAVTGGGVCTTLTVRNRAKHVMLDIRFRCGGGGDYSRA